MSEDKEYFDLSESDQRLRQANDELDSLREENERLKSVEQIIKQQRDRVVTELVAEKEKVRVLEECAEFYGKHDSWNFTDSTIYQDRITVVDAEVIGGKHRIGGGFARAALKKIEEMK